MRHGTRSFEIESVAPSVEFFLPSQSSCSRSRSRSWRSFTCSTDLVGCVATALVGVPGAPEFVKRYVTSTWGAYLLVLRWVPRGPERGVSDPTGIGIPLRSFSFLRSLFSLQGNWE